MNLRPLQLEAIARAAHTINRAYCQAIGDDSQPEWESAPDWQKDSAISGVKGTLDGSIATPEQSHESWLEHKRKDGWKYGAVKNPEAKEHPCFVPYAELPESQKVKDHLYHTAVIEAARLLGETEHG